jgi:hypothetical protein
MREFIQSKLNEISDIESGSFIPDGLVEIGKTYFGYQLQEDYQSSDFDKNDVRRVSIIGFIVRKNKPTENTQEIIDDAKNQIQNKLKELNFKVSTQDITLSDDIRKIKITGNVILNEINNELI